MPNLENFYKAIEHLRFPGKVVPQFKEEIEKQPSINYENLFNGDFLKNFVEPIPNLDELAFILRDAPDELKQKSDQLFNFKIQQLKKEGFDDEKISEHIRSLDIDKLKNLIRACIPQGTQENINPATQNILYTALFSLIKEESQNRTTALTNLNNFLKSLPSSNLLDDFETFRQDGTSVYQLLEPFKEAPPKDVGDLYNRLHIGYQSRRDYIKQLKTNVLNDVFYLRNQSELSQYNDENTNARLEKFAIEEMLKSKIVEDVKETPEYKSWNKFPEKQKIVLKRQHYTTMNELFKRIQVDNVWEQQIYRKIYDKTKNNQSVIMEDLVSPVVTKDSLGNYHIHCFIGRDDRLEDLKKKINTNLHESSWVNGFKTTNKAFYSIEITGKNFEELEKSFENQIELLSEKCLNPTGEINDFEALKNYLISKDNGNKNQSEKIKQQLTKKFRESYSQILPKTSLNITDLTNDAEDKILIHRLAQLAEIKPILARLFPVLELNPLDNLLKYPQNKDELQSFCKSTYDLLAKNANDLNDGKFLLSEEELKQIRSILSDISRIKESEEKRKQTRQQITKCFEDAATSSLTTEEVAKSLAQIIHDEQSLHKERLDESKNTVENYLSSAKIITRLIRSTERGEPLLTDEELEHYTSLINTIKSHIKENGFDYSECHFKVNRRTEKITIHQEDKESLDIPLDSPVDLPFALVKSAGNSNVDISIGGSRGNIAPIKDIDKLRYGSDSEKKSKERLFTHCLSLGYGQYGVTKIYYDLITGLPHVKKEVLVSTNASEKSSPFTKEAQKDPYFAPLTSKFDEPDIEIWLLQELQKTQEDARPLTKTEQTKQVTVTSSGTLSAAATFTESPTLYDDSQFKAVKMDQVLASGIPLKTYNDIQHGAYSEQSPEFHDPVRRKHEVHDFIEESTKMAQLSLAILDEAQKLKDAGFTHNDIKPENFLFRESPFSNHQYKVSFIDFATGGLKKASELQNNEDKNIETAAKILGCEVSELKNEENNLKFTHEDGRFVEFNQEDSKYTYGRNPVLDILPRGGKKQGTLSYLYDVRQISPNDNAKTQFDAEDETLDNWALMTMIFGICHKESYFALSEGRKLPPYLIANVIERDGDQLKPGEKFEEYFGLGEDKPELMFIPSTRTEGEPLHFYKRLQDMLEKDTSLVLEQEKEKIKQILTAVESAVESKEPLKKETLKTYMQDALGIFREYELRQNPDIKDKLNKQEIFERTLQLFDEKKPNNITNGNGNEYKDLEILCLYPSTPEQIAQAKTKLTSDVIKEIVTQSVFKNLLSQILTDHQHDIFSHVIKECPEEEKENLQQKIKNDYLLNRCLEQGVDCKEIFEKLPTEQLTDILFSSPDPTTPDLKTTYSAVELAVITKNKDVLDKIPENIPNNQLESALRMSAARHDIDIFQNLYQKLAAQESYTPPYKILFQTSTSLELFKEGGIFHDKLKSEILYPIACSAAMHGHFAGVKFLMEHRNWKNNPQSDAQGLLYHILASSEPQKNLEMIIGLRTEKFNDFVTQEMQVDPHSFAAIREKNDFYEISKKIFDKLTPTNYKTFLNPFTAYAIERFKDNDKIAEIGTQFISTIQKSERLSTEQKIPLLNILSEIENLKKQTNRAIKELSPTEYESTPREQIPNSDIQNLIHQITLKEKGEAELIAEIARLREENQSLTGFKTSVENYVNSADKKNPLAKELNSVIKNQEQANNLNDIWLKIERTTLDTAQSRYQESLNEQQEKFKDQLNKLNAQVRSMKIQSSNQGEKNTELQNKISEYEEKFINLEETNKQLQERLKELTQELAEEKEQKENASAELKHLREQFIKKESIINELTSNIENLTKQLADQDALKSENSELTSKITKLEQQLSTLEQTSTENQTLRDELAKLKEKLIKQDSIIDTNNQNINELTSNIENLTNQLTVQETLKSENSELTSKITKLEQQLSTLEQTSTENQTLRDELAKLKEKLIRQDSIIDTNNQNINELTSNIENLTKQLADQDALKSENSELTSKITELQKQLLALQKDLEEKDRLEQQLQALTQENSELRPLIQENEDLKKQIEGLKKTIEDKKELVASLQESLRKLQSELKSTKKEHKHNTEELTTTLDETGAQLLALQNKNKELNNELQSFKDLERNIPENITSENETPKLQAYIEKLKSEIQELKCAIETQQSAFEEQIKKATQKDSTLTYTLSKNQDLQDKVTNLEAQIDELRAQNPQNNQTLIEERLQKISEQIQLLNDKMSGIQPNREQFNQELVDSDNQSLGAASIEPKLTTPHEDLNSTISGLETEINKLNAQVETSRQEVNILNQLNSRQLLNNNRELQKKIEQLQRNIATLETKLHELQESQKTPSPYQERAAVTNDASIQTERIDSPPQEPRTDAQKTLKPSLTRANLLSRSIGTNESPDRYFFNADDKTPSKSKFSAETNISIVPENNKRLPLSELNNFIIYANVGESTRNPLPTINDKEKKLTQDELEQLKTAEGLKVTDPNSAKEYQISQTGQVIKAFISDDQHIENNQDLALTIMNIVENVVSKGKHLNIKTDDVFMAKIADLYANFLKTEMQLAIQYQPPQNIDFKNTSHQPLIENATQIFESLKPSMLNVDSLNKTPWFKAAQAMHQKPEENQDLRIRMKP